MSMSITYSNTRWDSVRWYLHLGIRHWFNWCLTICMSVNVTWIGAKWLPEGSSAFAKAFSLATLFLIFFVGLWVLVLALGALITLVSRNPGFFTQHSLTISPEGFVEETSINRTEHKWDGVLKVVRQPNYLLIYIASNQAHVIPRRAFQTQTEWESFCSSCEKFVAA